MFVEVAQLRRRLESDLLQQIPAEISIDRQRIGVPAAEVQGQHQLGTRSLMKWVLADNPLQFGN